MSRRRHAVRLGIPALIVAALALLALWRVGPTPEPLRPVGTAGLEEPEASIEHIVIRQLTSATTFWAGEIEKAPVFVVVDAKATRAPGVKLVAGREVTLVGAVRPAPAEDEMMRSWRIDAATAESVRKAGSYLHATDIE